MIEVSITRLWWLSLLFLAVSFAAKVWAFKMLRFDMVDSLLAVVIVWLIVVICSTRMEWK
jgi:hypothetical protein